MGYLRQAGQWLWALLPLAFFVWVGHGIWTAPERAADASYHERVEAQLADHDLVLDATSGITELETRIRAAVSNSNGTLLVQTSDGAAAVPKQSWSIDCDGAGLRLSLQNDPDALLLSSGSFSQGECATLIAQAAHVLAAISAEH